MKKKYSNDDITIVWEAQKCTHAAECVKLLPNVYKPQQRPWITIENANSDQLIDQINRCPSGALSFYMNKDDAPPVNSSFEPNEAIIADTKPIVVELVKDETKYFCTCGSSVNQPFCDGKHAKTSFKPMGFKSEKSGSAYLCMCKQSSNLPYCDGTHSKLK